MSQQRLFMNADTIGGVWTYALELIQALAPYRYEVLLATLGKPLSRSQIREASRIPNLTICESSYKLEWMDDPWEDVETSGQWLMELATQFSPDLVHLNTYSHGVLPWSVPVIMVAHSCVYSWWRAVKRGMPPADWLPYRRKVRAGLKGANLVVAPTHAMLDALTAHYGPLRSTHVIYNGRAPARFAPAPKEALILAIGRLWDEAKNIRILDQVAPDLSWPIYVAGEQQHPSRERMELQHLITLGHLDPQSVQKWLARASIYALPAQYEPFGLSALEAALSGCALVLGDIPSLREVWGNAACFVPPSDAAALTSVLEELINSPRTREQLGKQAHSRALRYSDTAMGLAYHHIYQQLLQGSQHTQPVPQRNHLSAEIKGDKGSRRDQISQAL